jgi:hypothetical protein
MPDRDKIKVNESVAIESHRGNGRVKVLRINAAGLVDSIVESGMFLIQTCNQERDYPKYRRVGDHFCFWTHSQPMPQANNRIKDIYR